MFLRLSLLICNWVFCFCALSQEYFVIGPQRNQYFIRLEVTKYLNTVHLNSDLCNSKLCTPFEEHKYDLYSICIRIIQMAIWKYRFLNQNLQDRTGEPAFLVNCTDDLPLSFSSYMPQNHPRISMVRVLLKDGKWILCYPTHYSLDIYVYLLCTRKQARYEAYTENYNYKFRNLLLCFYCCSVIPEIWPGDVRYFILSLLLLSFLWSTISYLILDRNS